MDSKKYIRWMSTDAIIRGEVERLGGEAVGEQYVLLTARR